MQDTDFHEEKMWGELSRGAGYLAFIPRKLPPAVSWRTGLVRRLSDAERALGALAGAGRQLIAPYLLIRPFMRREAVLSSRIEGTQASLADVFFYETAEEVRPRAADVREVVNYVRALEYGLERLRTFPLSQRFIRELHETLMRDSIMHGARAGEFRTVQNWIGPPGSAQEKAHYVPPPPGETLLRCLDAFEEYLNASSDLPPLARLAAVHYQFEAIHPFIDGNGRVGRLLITLMLCQEKLLPHPLLYLSAFFESHRQEYYAHLLNVSRRGAWEDWIQFFAEGVHEQANDARRRVGKLLSLRETYTRDFQKARTTSLTLRLIDDLFSRPVVTVGSAQRLLEVTKRTAQQHIKLLVDGGILEETSGRERGRTYLAREILRALDEPIEIDVE